MLKKLLLTLIFVPQMALAGSFSLNPSWGAYKRDSDNSMAGLELRVGYTFDMGLYIGGFYNLGTQKFLEDANEYYMGPMIGYQWNGIYGLASYVITGEQDLKSGGVKYSSANGYQVSLGYRMLLAEDIYVGPEITMREVEFSSQETQGIGIPYKREDSVIIPSIAFLFNF